MKVILSLRDPARWPGYAIEFDPLPSLHGADDVPAEPEQPQQSDDLRGLVETPQPGLVAEFWVFLKDNKKWWLLPILIAILLLGALVVLSSSGLGPFIYPFV